MIFISELKKEVQKVDSLTTETKKTFNLTKSEALERLKAEKVTESEQMLNKWCRDGEIEAVRVSKGAPKDRGLRISEKSLEAFILTKTGKVEALLDELLKLKAENKELKKEIRELKSSGIRKPRAKSAGITEAFLVGDTLSFKMDRAKHQATFEKDVLVKIERNTRKGFTDITDKVTDDIKEAVMETKKKLNR